MWQRQASCWSALRSAARLQNHPHRRALKCLTLQLHHLDYWSFDGVNIGISKCFCNGAGAQARPADDARSPADAGSGSVLRGVGHPAAGHPCGAAVSDGRAAAAPRHSRHAHRLALVRL